MWNYVYMNYVHGVQSEMMWSFVGVCLENVTHQGVVVGVAVQCSTPTHWMTGELEGKGGIYSFKNIRVGQHCGWILELYLLEDCAPLCIVLAAFPTGEIQP